LFSPPLPLEVGPLIAAREHFWESQAGPTDHGCQTVFGEFQAKNISPQVATIIMSFSGNETSNCVVDWDFRADCRRSGVRIPVWKKKFFCVYLPSLSYKCYVAMLIYALSDMLT